MEEKKCPNLPITPKLKEILNEIEIPEEKRGEILEVVQASVTVFSGPIPPAELLAGYNKIIPDGADRIMKMAEDQSKYRMEIERIVIESQEKQGKKGQMFAFGLGAIGMISSTLIAIFGAPWVAAVIGGSTLGTLVVAFLRGKKEMEKDIEMKSN